MPHSVECEIVRVPFHDVIYVVDSYTKYTQANKQKQKKTHKI